MKTKFLFLSMCLVMMGCASEKAMTPEESVQGAQDRVDKTNEFVNRADATITEFEKNIQAIMKEAASSDKMRGKARFNEALTGIDEKLAESRHQLVSLKETNAESWEKYKGQLDSAGDDMHSAFKKTND
jgi:wobble nucleotide-excising tRNase